MRQRTDEELIALARLLSQQFELCAWELEHGYGDKVYVSSLDGKPLRYRLKKRLRKVTVRERIESFVENAFDDPIGRAMARNHDDLIRYTVANLRYVFGEMKKIERRLPQRYRRVCRRALLDQADRVLRPCFPIEPSPKAYAKVLELFEGRICDGHGQPKELAEEAAGYVLHRFGVTANALRNGPGALRVEPNSVLTFLVDEVKNEIEKEIYKQKRRDGTILVREDAATTPAAPAAPLPALLTDQLRDRLIRLKTGGFSLNVVAQETEIAEELLLEWIEEGNSAASGPLKEFATAMSRSEMDCLVGSYADLYRDAVKGRQQAQTWFTERAVRARWPEVDVHVASESFIIKLPMRAEDQACVHCVLEEGARSRLIISGEGESARALARLFAQYFGGDLTELDDGQSCLVLPERMTLRLDPEILVKRGAPRSRRPAERENDLV